LRLAGAFAGRREKAAHERKIGRNRETETIEDWGERARARAPLFAAPHNLNAWNMLRFPQGFAILAYWNFQYVIESGT